MGSFVETPRILIHSPYPLAGGANGVDNFISEICPYLREHGYGVRISGPSKRKEKTQADYTLGRAWKIPLFNNTQAEVGLTIPFTKERAEKIILTTKPDVVVMHEPLAGNSAHTLMVAMPRRKDGTPFPANIGHFHSLSEILDWRTRSGLFIAKYVLRLPQLGKFKLPTDSTPGYMNTVMGELDGRIAVSGGTGFHWNEIYPGDYEVIPNGIDTKKFKPEGSKIKEWLEEVTDENENKIGPIIMMAGRHDPRKRMDVGIEAFAKIREVFPNARLKITGFGKETGKLKKKVKELGISMVDDKGRPIVDFVGILPKGDLPMAYRTADLFMALSDSGEGWGRVGVEALASGTPIVITAIKGHLEAARGFEFAYFVEPSNVRDTAKAAIDILKISNRIDATKRMESYKEVDLRYSWPIISKQTEKYYEYCINKRGRVLKSDWPKKERKSEIAKNGTVFERSGRNMVMF